MANNFCTIILIAYTAHAYNIMIMAQNMDTTKTGWPIPTKVKDDFVEFCARVETHAQADCAGALFLWLHMPPQIREWAKLAAKGEDAMPPEFWTGLREGLADSLPSQLGELGSNTGA